ncbi:beta-propeller domain-containing protein [Candidatus Thiothrix sp. Deng01]|uniref:Beta-propeller domain-containing protein n=1 Tax=Candidatus Thiothrix phosphatis TaxID=3112415 RepID=A0ABU6CW55_9GAMM|nr:beta-propeller domain-containing protein [Candidatus Thiothrix sp. Deng01]MEB4591046.1 beta-propeller domain-containing protein [Candidatus Thiothrix sp. Deng01]
MKNPFQTGAVLVVALLLNACGGGGSTTSVNNNNGGNNGGGSAPASKPELKQASASELESLIRQQMLALYGAVRPKIYPVAYADGTVTMVSDVAASSAGTAASSVSSTNVQETGVDEADRIKSDGGYLYTTSITTPDLRIFKADQASATLVKDMTLDSANAISLNGLYLNGQKLAVLGEEQQRFGIWDQWFAPSYWVNQESSLYMLNVANPASPTQTAKLTLDGQLISSRKIGSSLYLATRYSPTLPGLIQFPSTEAEATANRSLINKASLSDFLPNYKLDSGVNGKLFQSDDCFLTQYSSKDNQQASIISLLVVDMNAPAPIPRGKCFAGDTETLYASPEAIYLATTQYNYAIAAGASVSSNGSSSSIATYDPAITTDLHKFSLANGGIDYRGSGRVNGHLGWQQDLKPFRMSEYNDVLRILTYTGSWSDRTASPASLYTLQENSANQSLDILAKLPNSTHPEPLGKVGEQIYATRFLGDKGYLVTFRTTDPLYILDLSNPADPFVASELKIDGYSDYLHPVGENYLLGIGKDAITDTSSSTGDEGRGAWYQGVKLSLIDITNPSSPYEKQKITIGKRGTETAVSQTHHALTTLQQGDNLQMALPISLHEGSASYSSGPSTYYNWTQDELFRLNIDTRNGVIQPLAPVVAATGSSSDGYDYLWPYDRSVMIGNYIHYLHGDEVISQAW